MERYEGSDGVSNARTAIVILAVILLFIGIVTSLIGFVGEGSYVHKIYWDVVAYGLFFLFLFISLFITNAFLKGVEHIAKASEMYMEELRKKNENEKSKKVEEKLNYLIND